MFLVWRISVSQHSHTHGGRVFGLFALFAGLLFVGCASHPPARTIAIVNRGENLIATRGREPAPPKAGPEKSVDVSKEHLLEIYNGQQKIIERMEAQQRKQDAQKRGERTDDLTELAEGQAAPLPDDISPNDLLRIIEKQQFLIQALNSSSRNE
jgi:hypothetical protein